MIWQRVCLAVGFTAGAVLCTQQAFAQPAEATNPPAETTPQGQVSNPPADASRPSTPSTNANKPSANAGKPSAAKSSKANTPKAARVDHSQPVRASGGPKVIVDVDLSTQRMHVQFPDGSVADWPISSGRPGLDTPDGRYKAQWIDPDHVSKEYDDAPMPYAVFFDLKGHAIHGSYQKVFGVAVSHGCVRLPVKDAKRLYEAVKVSGAEIDIAGRAPRKGGNYWARREPKGYGTPQSAYGYGYRYGYGDPYGYRGPYRPYPEPPQEQRGGFFSQFFGGF